MKWKYYLEKLSLPEKHIEVVFKLVAVVEQF